MIKKILSCIVLGVLVVMPVLSVLLSPPHQQDFSSFQTLENYLDEHLVLADPLRTVSAELSLLAGQKERDGVFYTSDGLLQNFWPTESNTVRQRNTDAIITFAQNHDVPTYSVVIPTAVAIKQKLVPDNAPLYNQKEIITTINRAMEGKVTAIDVYPTLFQAYDDNAEYLYYRTSPRLTTLGGYRVYSDVAERMRLSPRPLRRFSKEYAYHDYYGELTSSWSSKKVQGDILTLYQNTTDSQGYQLTVTNTDGSKSVYNTLFPRARAMLGNPFDIYLGGECIRFDLRVLDRDEGGGLLVFGDDSIESFLPFLAQHYGQVTYINLALISKADLVALNPNSYDQVLFAYSLETFCDSSEISKATAVS